MTHITHNTSASESITITICFKSPMQTFSQQMALFSQSTVMCSYNCSCLLVITVLNSPLQRNRKLEFRQNSFNAL